MKFFMVISVFLVVASYFPLSIGQEGNTHLHVHVPSTSSGTAASSRGQATSRVSRIEDNLGNYAFGYDEIHSTGGSFRREQATAGGGIVGSYGLRDADGRLRIVNYVADENGFRVAISSNEPGIGGDSAGVIINKGEQPPPPVIDETHHIHVSTSPIRAPIPVPKNTPVVHLHRVQLRPEEVHTHSSPAQPMRQVEVHTHSSPAQVRPAEVHAHVSSVQVRPAEVHAHVIPSAPRTITFLKGFSNEPLIPDGFRGLSYASNVDHVYSNSADHVHVVPISHPPKQVQGGKGQY